MKRHLLARAVVIGAISLGVYGCATNGHVKEPISETVSAQIEEPQLELAEKHLEITNVEETIEPSEDEFPAEAILSEQTLHFRFDRSELSREVKAALDSLVKNLVVENKDIQFKIGFSQIKNCVFECLIPGGRDINLA